MPGAPASWLIICTPLAATRSRMPGWPPEKASSPCMGARIRGSIGRTERMGPTSSGTCEWKTATSRDTSNSTMVSQTTSAWSRPVCGRATAVFSIFTASAGRAAGSPATPVSGQVGGTAGAGAPPLSGAIVGPWVTAGGVELAGSGVLGLQAATASAMPASRAAAAPRAPRRVVVVIAFPRRCPARTQAAMRGRRRRGAQAVSADRDRARVLRDQLDPGGARRERQHAAVGSGQREDRALARLRPGARDGVAAARDRGVARAVEHRLGNRVAGGVDGAGVDQPDLEGDHVRGGDPGARADGRGRGTLGAQPRARTCVPGPRRLRVAREADRDGRGGATEHDRTGLLGVL